MLDFYDEIQVTVERLEEEKGKKPRGQRSCAYLGNMLADAARDAGVSKENFLRTMEVTWMQDTDEPPIPALIPPRPLHLIFATIKYVVPYNPRRY
jgi:hypothetical protein